MAHIYIIRCPKCGKEYEATKGIFVSECGIDPIPEDRQEDTPAVCPHCGHKLDLQEESSKAYIESIMLAD